MGADDYRKEQNRLSADISTLDRVERENEKIRARLREHGLEFSGGFEWIRSLLATNPNANVDDLLDNFINSAKG